MPKSRTFLSLFLFAVFVATFALGFTLVVPAPAYASCDLGLVVPQCPGIGCLAVRYECNCTNNGGQPRLEQILYCEEDPSIIFDRQCTNKKC
ncbi:MAG TPA: hypothetical protein VKU40_02550 [Thermoanaerobaculia bacterium]|nr:hypothetical protein [Thermoanaerobaculia bacterium]